MQEPTALSWIIITEEDAKAASLDSAALRRDIEALHGTGGSWPAKILRNENRPQPVRTPGLTSPGAGPAARQALSGTAGQSSMRAPMTATRSASPCAGSAGSRPVSSLTRASR
jgi:hypothetical protein